MGRRKGTTAFPVARIKKMMQSDDEVGKIATVTPMLVAKALECMMELVVTQAAHVAIDRRSRTVTPLHLKSCVMRNDDFDFLRPVFHSVDGLLPDENDDQHQHQHQHQHQQSPTAPTTPNLDAASSSPALHLPYHHDEPTPIRKPRARRVKRPKPDDDPPYVMDRNEDRDDNTAADEDYDDKDDKDYHYKAERDEEGVRRRMNKLQKLSTLGNVESVEKSVEQEKLDKLAKLDKLDKLEKLDKFDKLDKLDKLPPLLPPVGMCATGKKKSRQKRPRSGSLSSRTNMDGQDIESPSSQRVKMPRNGSSGGVRDLDKDMSSSPRSGMVEGSASKPSFVNDDEEDYDEDDEQEDENGGMASEADRQQETISKIMNVEDEEQRSREKDDESGMVQMDTERLEEEAAEVEDEEVKRKQIEKERAEEEAEAARRQSMKTAGRVSVHALLS